MYKKVWKFFSSTSEEEAFLNKMAKDGYMVKNKRGHTFYFEKCEKNREIIYKVYFRLFKRKGEFDEYVDLCKASGWELIYGSCYNGVLCFLRLSKENYPNDVFPDEVSRIDVIKKKQQGYFFIISFYIISILFIITASQFDKRLANITIFIWPLLIVLLIAFVFLAIKNNLATPKKG